MTSQEHEHQHGHEHKHQHGHDHDQGLSGMLRYLRFLPQMWSSEVNTAVVSRLAPKTGETLMDIGAGIGAATMVAAKADCKIMAVEPTPYMRNVLSFRRLVTRTSDRVHIVDGTAEATTVAAKSIDAAWAVNTMHHWASLDDGVSELARTLAPGGRVLLVDESFDDPRHPDFEQFGSKRNDEHKHHFHTVDPAVVGQAMTEAGLTVTFAGHDDIAGRPAVVLEATAPG